MDGYDYWDNPYFRNESINRASDMIREAVGITLYFWRDLPFDGFHSFVNPRKVKPIIRRGKPIYGFCFERAGFQLWPELTRSRKLLRYVLSAGDLLFIEPIQPFSEQLALC
jgi:hypothetical protein